MAAPTTLDMWYETWLPLAGIALGLAITLAAIVYMLGSALMNDRMKGWAKLELVEIFYSGVIIALIATPGLGALMVVDSVVQGGLFLGSAPMNVYVPETGQTLPLCGNAIAAQPESVYYNVPACHMRLGIWYMHTLFKEASDFAYKDYLTYIYTATMADFTINFEFITEAAGFFSVTPWRGFFTTGNTIKSMVFDYAIKLMILMKFQEIMLSFIAKALFPALFVVGAILRTFTFSRRLGGLLLAMAISLYYVFPMFYAFGGLVVWDLKNQVKAMPGFNQICTDIAGGRSACNDPPISNTMYITGELPMPGGGIKTGESMDSADALNRKTAGDRMKQMESDTGGSKPLEGVAGAAGADFAKNVPLAEREVGMSIARNATGVWFSKVSSQSKFDSGVFIAYKPGGPVDALSRIAFFSTFFSLFGILATIAAIRSLSVTLGGDVEIAGLTHLI